MQNKDIGNRCKLTIRKLFLSIILIVFILLYYSCNKSRKVNSNSISTEDSVLNKIKQGLSKLPNLPRKSYIIEDNQNEISVRSSQIIEINYLKELNTSSDKFKSVEDLLEMELGLGIHELLQINKLNYSYLPADRKYFYLDQGFGISEKYVSRKTKSVVSGFVYYKTNEEYYTYHIVDTVNFDLDILGKAKDSVPFKIVYKIIKDSLIESENVLIFRNDTILRYKANITE